MDKVRIAIVEDDPIQNLGLASDLEDMGYEVVSQAEDAKQALQDFQRYQPDLMLIDINLGSDDSMKGDASGIDLAKKLKSIQAVPVIYVTAVRQSETFNKALETSPEQYIVKPYVKEDLHRAIELAIFKYKGQEDSEHPDDSVLFNDHLYFSIRQSRMIRKIKLQDIVYVESHRNDKLFYTQSYPNPLRSAQRINMGELIEQLSNIFLQGHQQNHKNPFLRIHDSFIINLFHFQEDDISTTKIETKFKGKAIELNVGRTYRKIVRARWGAWFGNVEFLDY